jgi:cell division protein FtsB
MRTCAEAATARAASNGKDDTANMARTVSITGMFLPVGFLVVGAYFTFTAVQGNYGLFQRIQITAEADRLEAQLAALREEVARMETLTRRLSDEFLDLDLLDEQARDVLGYVRADEVILP